MLSIFDHTRELAKNGSYHELLSHLPSCSEVFISKLLIELEQTHPSGLNQRMVLRLLGTQNPNLDLILNVTCREDILSCIQSNNDTGLSIILCSLIQSSIDINFSDCIEYADTVNAASCSQLLRYYCKPLQELDNRLWHKEQVQPITADSASDIFSSFGEPEEAPIDFIIQTPRSP
ncbi:hypothetical protein MMH89_03370 [Candidatus Comchoanobacter bicostacola]|uniref:Uncharacterized protein n=1 Tax=Candidatus Comchoanobacter bicostacola TaxID=2919598 RepID=A0ABY5DJV8_9GAMM|nr:hypothetical protein [Candidatus Comchoanobacter bicostacola]UTC24263.1 hypothetical protein MMH89_03370 [Candidatus Comchoanobacter bicostacola]